MLFKYFLSVFASHDMSVVPIVDVGITRDKIRQSNFLFSSNSPSTMATLLPPPSKRQKVAQAEKAREQQEIQSIPTDLGSVRVQFFDQATGNATGPAVSVPVADAKVKNLETLLNTLQGNVSLPMNSNSWSCASS